MIKEVNKLEEFKNKKKYTSTAIGFFDGVHKGHQEILKNLIKFKDEKNIPLIITFFKNKKDTILTSSEKYTLLDKFTNYKCDILALNLDSQNILKVNKDKFILFLKELGIQSIFVGKDFRFGYKAEGDVTYLEKFFNVEVCDFVKDTLNEKISSRIIIQKLKKGKIVESNNELGYNYFVKGFVEEGNKLGRQLNFPTLNLSFDNYLLPNGVYKSRVRYQGKIYNSITNIGIRPTVTDEKKIIVETNIYDNKFNQEIYNEEIEVEFLDYIREEKKFKNLEELKKQIQKDILKIKEKNENKGIS